MVYGYISPIRSARYGYTNLLVGTSSVRGHISSAARTKGVNLHARVRACVRACVRLCVRAAGGLLGYDDMTNIHCCERVARSQSRGWG